MDRKGFISLHRKIQDHDMWLSESFDKPRAWIDLLLIANFKPGYLDIRGNRVEIKRGQIGWSKDALATRWKWSKKKVLKYLNTLERDKQIIQHKSQVLTVVEINNYDIYQQNAPQDALQSAPQTALQTALQNTPQDAPQKSKQTHPKYKENKNKKEKERDARAHPIPSLQDVKDYCKEVKSPIDPERFFGIHEAAGWEKNNQPIKNWKAIVKVWGLNERPKEGQKSEPGEFSHEGMIDSINWFFEKPRGITCSSSQQKYAIEHIDEIKFALPTSWASTHKQKMKIIHWHVRNKRVNDLTSHDRKYMEEHCKSEARPSPEDKKVDDKFEEMKWIEKQINAGEHMNNFDTMKLANYKKERGIDRYSSL